MPSTPKLALLNITKNTTHCKLQDFLVLYIPIAHTVPASRVRASTHGVIANRVHEVRPRLGELLDSCPHSIPWSGMTVDIPCRRLGKSHLGIGTRPVLPNGRLAMFQAFDVKQSPWPSQYLWIRLDMPISLGASSDIQGRECTVRYHGEPAIATPFR